MGLENPTYIEDLNPLWPLASDPVSEGDNHIQNIKATLQASFPGTSGAWNAPGQTLNLAGLSASGAIFGQNLTLTQACNIGTTLNVTGQATFTVDIACRDINARDGFYSGGIDVEGDASIKGEIRENSQVAIAGGRIDATGAFDGANFGLAQAQRIQTGVYEIQLVTGATQFKDLGLSIAGNAGLAEFSANFAEPSTNPNDGRWFRVATWAGGTLTDIPFHITVFDHGRD